LDGKNAPALMGLLSRQDLLLARIEQVLASADEVERQYIAAAIRGGHERIGV